MVGQFTYDSGLCSRCGVLLALSHRSVCAQCVIAAMHPTRRAQIEHMLANGWRVREAGHARPVRWFSIKSCE